MPAPGPFLAGREGSPIGGNFCRKRVYQASRSRALPCAEPRSTVEKDLGGRMKLKRTIVAPALVAGVALVPGGWLPAPGGGGRRPRSTVEKDLGGRMKLKRTIVAPALVAGVALVSGGWLLQQGVSGQQSVFQRARIFDEVLQYVESRYVDEHSESDLYQKAIEGMLQELGDPHTVFMT